MSKKKTTPKTSNKLSLDETLKMVEKSGSSIFGKTDVINLLKGINIDSKSVKTKVPDREEIIQRLENIIDSAIGDLNKGDIVDSSSFEFTLNGNEIEVSDYEIDTSTISHEIISEIESNFDDIFED